MAGWFVAGQLDLFHLAVLTMVCTCCYWLGIALQGPVWRYWDCSRLGLQCRACSGLQQRSFQHQQTVESLGLQGEEAGAQAGIKSSLRVSAIYPKVIWIKEENPYKMTSVLFLCSTLKRV